MPEIARYLNVRSAYAPAFEAGGERLSFLMDTTGVPQVWSLDAPGAWPEQRTFADERVTFVAASPERPTSVFGMDEGGNERGQLYRLDADGSIAALTDRPSAKHRWGAWSNAGDRIAYTANRRDESVFDVYVQGIDETAEDARLLVEADGWLTAGDWSPDDSRVVVTEAHSNYDQDVHVLDVEAGGLEHVTPHEGDVRYGDPDWSADGRALYLTTDADAETLYLGRLDLESLEIEPVVDGGDWNVEWAHLDAESGRLVHSRNVDGYSEVAVGRLVDDIEVEEGPGPRLPRGVCGGVDFGPDADRFAVTVTGRTTNPDVFVVEAATGEATRWTRASTAGLDPGGFVEPETVRFESFDGREIPAFLSLPPGAAGPSPAIVDVHGGPEAQRRPSFSAVTQYFLASGYAVFEPNVRGSTGYGKTYTRLDDVRRRPDAVADLAAGADWLAGHPDVDADRLVALGASYGGFMVLAALTRFPRKWAAGIDVVGIANFVTFLEHTGDWRRALREAEYGSLDDDREFLEEISPINHLEAIEAPLLVLHGANDPRVPVGEAEQVAEEAAEHVPVRTVIFEDEGHGFSKLENRIEAYEAIVAFLDEYVRDPRA